MCYLTIRKAKRYRNSEKVVRNMRNGEGTGPIHCACHFLTDHSLIGLGRIQWWWSDCSHLHMRRWHASSNQQSSIDALWFWIRVWRERFQSLRSTSSCHRSRHHTGLLEGRHWCCYGETEWTLGTGLQRCWHRGNNLPSNEDVRWVSSSLLNRSSCRWEFLPC